MVIKHRKLFVASNQNGANLSKMRQNIWQMDPLGELMCSPSPPRHNDGPTSKEREEREGNR